MNHLVGHAMTFLLQKEWTRHFTEIWIYNTQQRTICSRIYI